MEKTHNPHIQEIAWKEAKGTLKYINPTLTDIINTWNPPADHTLLKVSYNYGDSILKEGTMFFPDSKGILYSIDSPKTSKEITEKLAYSTVPLGVIIRGGNEVFLETENRTVSLAFFKPGTILGLWETLDPASSHFPKRIWSACAGARSLFMLPKISEALSHKKLKKRYGVKSPAPKQMYDHSKIFAEIAKSKEFKSDWSNEIIFFTNKWLERRTDDIGWLRFHHYLLESVWELSDYHRNRITYDRFWQLFAKSLEKQGIRPSSYLMDTVKHLISIGLGAVPGFKPAGDTEFVGPVHALQDVYINDYGLKQYVPTIMEPCHFSEGEYCRHLYYSLQMPTLLESLPQTRLQSKIISEIRELKMLIDNFFKEALDGVLKIDNSRIEWLINNVEYDFFHSEKDIYGEIRLASEMPKEDPALVYTMNKYKNKTFSEAAPFMRGCVRISRH